MTPPRGADGKFVSSTPSARYERRGDGYCRWRAYDAMTGREEYVYVHQLLACVDNDPHEVFDPTNHVHHVDGYRFHNTRDNIEVRNHVDHGNYHLHGVPLPKLGAIAE